MAEMREVKAAKSEPSRRKTVHHLEIHPAFGGGYRLEHHYNHSGLGSYAEPRSVKIAAGSEKAKHIDALMGVQRAEPGGGDNEDGAEKPAHMAPEGEEEDAEEGKD